MSGTDEEDYFGWCVLPMMQLDLRRTKLWSSRLQEQYTGSYDLNWYCMETVVGTEG